MSLSDDLPVQSIVPVIRSQLRSRGYVPARVDGKPSEVGPSPEGHVQITVEPGEHTLTLSFEDTRPRTAGKLVSAFSLLVWLAMLWVSRKGNETAPVPASNE